MLETNFYCFKKLEGDNETCNSLVCCNTMLNCLTRNKLTIKKEEILKTMCAMNKERDKGNLSAEHVRGK